MSQDEPRRRCFTAASYLPFYAVAIHRVQFPIIGRFFARLRGIFIVLAVAKAMCRMAIRLRLRSRWYTSGRVQALTERVGTCSRKWLSHTGRFHEMSCGVRHSWTIHTAPNHTHCHFN